LSMIIKAEYYAKGRFFKVSNQHLRSPQLSWQAKGLLDYLLSYGKTYQHSFAGIMRHSKEGEKYIRSTLKELVTAKYVSVQKVTFGNRGKFEWIYTVSEYPMDTLESTDSPDSLQAHTPEADVLNANVLNAHTPEADVLNGGVYNNKKHNTKITTNNETATTSCQPPAAVYFSPEEERILEWARNSEYWHSLVERPSDARKALDKSEPNSLVAQYTDAIKFMEKKKAKKADRVDNEAKITRRENDWAKIKMEEAEPASPIAMLKPETEAIRAKWRGKGKTPKTKTKETSIPPFPDEFRKELEDLRKMGLVIECEEKIKEYVREHSK
jgi:hypothetical protein